MAKLGVLYTYYRRLRYESRCRIANSPALFLYFADIKKRGGDPHAATRVTQDTDLVLEAFPRSGNTFAYFALLLSQSQPLRLAHHFHAPAQLIDGIRSGKPGLLIVREPMDTICSFVQREPIVTLRQALRAWIRFHTVLKPHHSGFVIATFDQVTTDFGLVIQRVNDRFGVRLDIFQHTQNNVDACFGAIDARNAQRFGNGRIVGQGVARPSAERAAGRLAVLAESNSPQLRPLLREANELYSLYAGWALANDTRTLKGRRPKDSGAGDMC